MFVLLTNYLPTFFGSAAVAIANSSMNVSVDYSLDGKNFPDILTDNWSLNIETNSLLTNCICEEIPLNRLAC